MGRGRKTPIEIGISTRHIAELATSATSMGIYTVESLKCGIYYFLEDDDIVLATSKGHIKADLKTMRTIAEEIPDIINDFTEYKRDRQKLMGSRAISKMLGVRDELR